MSPAARAAALPDFERLLGDLSAEFIQCPTDRLDALIEDAQRRICEALGLDMSTLWQSTAEDPQAFVMTHCFRPRGGPPLPAPMPSGTFFPWTTRMALDGKTVAISSLDELPAEAAADLEIRRSLGIKSFLILPLSAAKERVFGCLSFNAMGEERAWEDDVVNLLRLVAAIFANALSRKRTEERFREAESRYRMLVERMNDGLIVLDEGHRITYANRKMCEMLGVPADDILGRSPGAYLDEESRAVLAGQLEKRIRGEDAPYEVEWLTKSGKRLVTIVTPQPLFHPDGVYRGSFAVLTDISERKRAEALLKDDVERLRSILEATSGGVWDWNIISGAAVFSPKYSAMLGYEPEEFARHYDEWGVIVHPDDIDRVKQAHTDHFEKGQTFSVEFRMREKSGRWHWIHSRGILIERDAQGRPLRMVGTHQDIQERKNAELEGDLLRGELTLANRRAMLGELSSSLAHELNQPLGAILNNAEAARTLLARPRPDLGEIREILEDIIKDDVRAGDVIRKIRGLSKKKGMAFEPLNVGPLIQDILEIMGSSLTMNNVVVDLDAGPGLPSVLGDRVHLQQVLLNLITNAVEAMQGSAKRRLWLRAAETGERMLKVSIIDSGTGVDASAMDLVFKAFYTTKPDGLGMGLSICRSIIEAHGGVIRAENNPSGGAAFSFTLKTAPEPAP